MVVILALSSDAASSQQTGATLGPFLHWLLPWATSLQIDAAHLVVRKAAHVTVYAVLAALWFRAFVRGRGWPPRASALVALVIALVWASVDEVHQSFTSARTAAAGDVLIDGTGAALAVAMGGLGWSVVFERAADFLLLIAAAGGAFFVAVDLATGVPASVLWVVTPVAMAALAARRWQRRQPQGFEAPPSGP
jgi:VanZ family protein